jgi:hypothetical protein
MKVLEILMITKQLKSICQKLQGSKKQSSDSTIKSYYPKQQVPKWSTKQSLTLYLWEEQYKQKSWNANFNTFPNLPYKTKGSVDINIYTSKECGI